jgi:1,5-anhydro-D-fructose reductase (1,5-anhydro-D-mannitol-forming)
VNIEASHTKAEVVWIERGQDISGPPGWAVEQTMRCAAAAKHVLVEKPMALSLEDAIAMGKACMQANVKLYVGFHLRFHPAHQRAREAVRSGEIGDIVWADARWISHKESDVGWRVDPMRSGGDILTARGVHLIDLIRFVCGTEFESIVGISDGFKPDRGADAVTAEFGSLASGGFAHFVCTRLPRRVANGFDVYGTHGAVSCCSTMATEPSGLLSAGTLTISCGSRTETVPYGPCDAFVEECDYVSAAITRLSASSRLGAADDEDGKRATAVALGLVTSVETGRTVMLRPEPDP